MTPSPDTTVVIATRNRADELARTLSRLANLRPSPPVVVVDNASVDSTPDVAEMFGDVTVVRLDHNAGACARNAGVERVATPFVAFSDDDSWWAPGALPAAERVLRAHPDVGLLAATTLVGHADEPDPINADLVASPLPPVPGQPGPRVLGFLACASVARTAAYREAGGFSALLRFGAEETLLAYDLAATGWLVCHCADVRAHHHPSQQRPRPEDRRVRELRNRLLITVLRRPVRVVLAAWSRAVRGAVWDRSARRALAGAVRRLGPALRQRRRLPDEVERDVRLLEAA